MKSFAVITVSLALVQGSFAHYTWDKFIHGNTYTSSNVRVPATFWPIWRERIDTVDVRCNVNLTPASETLIVSPGDEVGFKVRPDQGNDKAYHEGIGSIYVAKAPEGVSVGGWNGDGEWIKIYTEGVESYHPIVFKSTNKTEIRTTLPNIPSGDYLIRVEHIAVHQPTTPQWFVACAQISVIGGSGTLPAGVKIPGYLTEKDHWFAVDIYDNTIGHYELPPPAVFRGN